MITIKEDEWPDILEKIKQDYPPSVYLIRANMRKSLGFVPRWHSQWIEKASADGQKYGHYKDYICLDFYSEAQETFFRLKYL